MGRNRRRKSQARNELPTDSARDDGSAVFEDALSKTDTSFIEEAATVDKPVPAADLSEAQTAVPKEDTRLVVDGALGEETREEPALVKADQQTLKSANEEDASTRTIHSLPSKNTTAAIDEDEGVNEEESAESLVDPYEVLRGDPRQQRELVRQNALARGLEPPEPSSSARHKSSSKSCACCSIQ